MSRVGRQPIEIGSNVKIDVDKGNKVTVTGPKGTLSQQISPDLTVEQENGHLIVKRPTDSRHHRSQHGLARALINNMVMGVTQGFSRRLEVRGTGYRAEQQGNKLVLQVGKSHPVEFVPPSKDISFEVAKDGRSFEIRGIDKCEVGELAAVIRKTRPPEPYKGKGIRYDGEYVRSKAGKAGKA
ncbi:MAG: 50S ribosomal protein L6 [Caldilineaceae bacterium]